MGPERGFRQRTSEFLRKAAPCIVLPIAALAARGENVNVLPSSPQIQTPHVLVLERIEFPEKDILEKTGMTLFAGVWIWGVWVLGPRSSDGSKNKFEKNSLKWGIPALNTLATSTLLAAMWR